MVAILAGNVDLTSRRRAPAIADACEAVGSLTGFEVRQRRDNDSEGLWRLFNQEPFQRFGAILEPFASAADVEAWFGRSGQGNYEIVGTLAGAVVAFAGLYPSRGRQSHVGSMSLCVHEAFQGRRIGTLLLKLVLSFADRLAGLRRLQLHVLTDNDRAISLYRTFGFQIEGRHEGVVCRDGLYVDAFTMARMIRQLPEFIPPAVEASVVHHDVSCSR